jgi:hypothetical protein
MLANAYLCALVAWDPEQLGETAVADRVITRCITRSAVSSP